MKIKLTWYVILRNDKKRQICNICFYDETLMVEAIAAHDKLFLILENNKFHIKTYPTFLNIFMSYNIMEVFSWLSSWQIRVV